jgi:hypothetical protein
MNECLNGVPLDALGAPMLSATNEADYQAYIDWLSDYLYRPEADLGEPLTEAQAGLELVEIEMEIADWIWTHPFDDYPPADRLPPSGARHWDILHREAISEVLSRVPDRRTRIRLLDSFYTELIADAHK